MDNLFFRIRALAAFWDIISRGDFMLGKTTIALERRLAEFLGVKYVLGVASCTDALMLSLKACEVEPGDEVIMPALGVMPTAEAAVWIGARPVFVDVREESLTIDHAKIERAITSRTKAIIVVHLTGRMADMEEISRIAHRKSIPVIEDAARAIGSRFKNYSPGHYGTAACFSFNPSKILPAYGDGGAVVTNDPLLAEKVRLMRTYGSQNYKEIGMDYPVIGIASRLSSFQAALLNLRVENIDESIEAARRNYFRYDQLLSGIEGLRLPTAPPEYSLNGYQYIALVPDRDKLLSHLKEHGVVIRVGEYRFPLPYFEALLYLGYQPGDFPIAEKICQEAIILPTLGTAAERNLEKTADLTKEFLSKHR